jgi:hypothetical protein
VAEKTSPRNRLTAMLFRADNKKTSKKVRQGIAGNEKATTFAPAFRKGAGS